MAFSLQKFIKGILIKEEGTLTPKAIEIIPGGSASTTTIITGSQTANRTITMPDATTTVVGTDATQTLTNKTLSGNTATNLISGAGTLTLNTSGTVTVPNATDTLVGKATTDTLTNKTLTGNTAVNLVSGSGTFTLNTTGTITAPNATDTLVGKATTDTLSNKTLDNSTVETIKDANLTIQDDADTTKQLKFQASGITTGTTRTLTAPDANTTIVGTDASQTLTNKTLTGNTAVNLISGAGTLTLNTTGTITVPNATDTLVGKATTDTLTNKTLTSPTINTPTITVRDNVFTVQDNGDNTKQFVFEASGITTGTTRTLTIPNASTTLVGTDATQTLTNKTLSGNTATNLISGAGTLTLNTTGTITVPNATDTLVGKATTDTLTNKTLTGNTAVNLISGAGTLTLNTTGTVTVPNVTDTLISRTSTDQGANRLTNKDLSDTTTKIVNTVDTTKKLSFAVNNNGTGITTTLSATSSTSQTIFLPNPSTSVTLIDDTTNQAVKDKMVTFHPLNDGTSGSNATISSPSGSIASIVKLAGQAPDLVSVSGIPAGTSGQFLILENKVGAVITINNEQAAAAAADRIITGTGANITMPIDSNMSLIYDTSDSRWRVLGGTFGLVSARYHAATTSISGTLANITYNTSDYDSHSAYSAGTYTIPFAGKYQINAAILMTATTTAANQLIQLQINKNGAAYSGPNDLYFTSSTSKPMTLVISDIVHCVAGDTITIQASNAGTTPSISASNSANYFSIARLGD